MKRTLTLVISLIMSASALIAGEQVTVAQPSPRLRLATFTRLDSSVTAYQAGDIVRASKVSGGAVSFVLAFPTSTEGKGAESGYITSVMLSADTCEAGAIFDLIVLDDTTGIGATLAKDNDPIQITSAYAGKIVGVIQGLSLSTYGTAAAGSVRSFASLQNINLPYTQTAARKLYFILVAQSAYTPKAGGTFSIRVAFEI